MKTRVCSVVIVLIAILMLSATVSAIEFLARYDPRYLSLTFIDTDDVYQEYLQDKAVIVDVRSKLEYETIHVKGSVHIPVGSYLFEKEVKALAEENPGKKIIFYCNGGM